MVEAAGLDSRANCALGLPRSRTSTGSPLCTVSPSNPLRNKAKEDIPQGHTFFYLVEAAGILHSVQAFRLVLRKLLVSDEHTEEQSALTRLQASLQTRFA